MLTTMQIKAATPRAARYEMTDLHGLLLRVTVNY